MRGVGADAFPFPIVFTEDTDDKHPNRPLARMDAGLCVVRPSENGRLSTEDAEDGRRI